MRENAEPGADAPKRKQLAARPASPAEIRRYERMGQMRLPNLPEPEPKRGRRAVSSD